MIIIGPFGSVVGGVVRGSLVGLVHYDFGVHISLNMLDWQAKIEYFRSLIFNGDSTHSFEWSGDEG